MTNVTPFPAPSPPPPVQKVFKNIMLDLETLDVKQTAVVTAIGAVAFDPESQDIGETFYIELVNDLVGQQKNGRTIDADTVRWWMSQPDAARKHFAKPEDDETVDVSCRHGTVLGLVMFRDFIQRHGGAKMQLWGNGSDFDNVILGSLYESYGLERPWSYGKNRCFRTMKNMLGAGIVVPRFGVHHNALDDAITQAKHLQEIVRCHKPIL